MKNVIKFIRLNFKVKWMLIQVLFLSANYRFRILYCPFSKLAPKIGTSGYETAKVEEFSPERLELLKQVKWTVGAVCRRTPWESKCLVQALTAKKLLNQRGIPCTLYMGVRKSEEGKMLAHAWLRCGRWYITGGNGSLEYTVTTIYGDKE